ncbi:hypothetical protein KM043_014903 [Ampulex compressa]|nr:hypothetical protein KM043_014903 [Ampulex compressa]
MHTLVREEQRSNGPEQNSSRAYATGIAMYTLDSNKEGSNICRPVKHVLQRAERLDLRKGPGQPISRNVGGAACIREIHFSSRPHRCSSNICAAGSARESAHESFDGGRKQCDLEVQRVCTNYARLPTATEHRRKIPHSIRAFRRSNGIRAKNITSPVGGHREIRRVGRRRLPPPCLIQAKWPPTAFQPLPFAWNPEATTEHSHASRTEDPLDLHALGFLYTLNNPYNVLAEGTNADEDISLGTTMVVGRDRDTGYPLKGESWREATYVAVGKRAGL